MLSRELGFPAAIIRKLSVRENRHDWSVMKLLPRIRTQFYWAEYYFCTILLPAISNASFIIYLHMSWCGLRGWWNRILSRTFLFKYENCAKIVMQIISLSDWWFTTYRQLSFVALLLPYSTMIHCFFCFVASWTIISTVFVFLSAQCLFTLVAVLLHTCICEYFIIQ